jgi:hypothetical protein
MLAIVASKHLLSLSDVYAQPLALARAPGPALIFREVCCRNPGPPRSSPPAGRVPSSALSVIGTTDQE